MEPKTRPGFSDITDGMYDSDEWEDVISWNQVCVLPPGCELDESECLRDDSEWVQTYLRGHFKSAYPDGTPKFGFEQLTDGRWMVFRQCPCGLSKCKTHVFPAEMRYVGQFSHEGAKLDALFMHQHVMTLSEAREWWSAYNKGYAVRVDPGIVRRSKRVLWSSVATFPKGHEKIGYVSRENVYWALQKSFDGKHGNGVSKYAIKQLSGGDGKYSVLQQCPCGLTECGDHVFPCSVSISCNFKLELHRRGSPVLNLEKLFRSQPAMTVEDAVAWFMSFPIKWRVTAKSKEISLRMICSCGKPFDSVPCAPCKAKTLAECAWCKKSVKKRTLSKEKKICQDCYHKERVHCPHCKRFVPRGHYDCVPLDGMHYTDKPTHIYPPMVRTKHSDEGICPDCGEGMKYKIYSRHQYRKHHDVAPCQLYHRKYEKRKCPYCEYTNFCPHNVTQHLKRHLSLRQYPCRHGCGATFTRASAEISHVKTAHCGMDVQPECTTVTKRRGNKIEKVTKRRRTCNYVELPSVSP